MISLIMIAMERCEKDEVSGEGEADFTGEVNGDFTGDGEICLWDGDVGGERGMLVGSWSGILVVRRREWS